MKVWVALIGDVTSKPCKAVAQKAAADNLPMLTPTGTQEDITDVGGERVPYLLHRSLSGVS